MSNVKFIDEANATSIAATNKLGSRKLAFEASAFPHLRKVLTELYSNARIAVFRETLANAEDSRNKSGKTHLPIEVTLPNVRNNWLLTIKDYGTGMSYEDIENVYSNYGGSSKRQVKGQIGEYGLGAKAALAITNRFDVISVKDGIETRFHMGVVDENDYSDDFSITYDSITETDAENGVEVRIPYPANSFSHKGPVYNAVLRGLQNIIVDGELQTDNLYNENRYNKLIGSDGEILAFYRNVANGNNYSDEASVNIFLGGVTYPVDYQEVISQLPEDKLTKEEKTNYTNALYALSARVAKSGKPFYIVVPTTVMKPTPNREDLYYSAETSIIMGRVAYETWGLLKAALSAEINEKISRKEALTVYNEWRSTSLLLVDGIRYRGEIIKTFYAPDTRHIGDHQGVYETHQNTGRRGGSNKVLVAELANVVNFAGLTSNSLIVKLPVELGSFETSEYVKKVTRRIKLFFAYHYSYQKLFFVSEQVYNDKWWNFSAAYSTKFVTIDDVYNEILAIARKERAAKVAVKTVTEFPYKKIFVHNPAQKLSYSVHTVTNEEKEITKPILYTTPREMLVQSPDYEKESTREPEFWDFYFENFNDNYTILALTTRQRVEAFKKKYPEAKSLRETVKAEIAKQGAESVNYGWENVRLKMEYSARVKFEKIIVWYALATKFGFKDDSLDKAAALFTRTVAPKKGVAHLYQKFVNSTSVSNEKNIDREAYFAEEIAEQWKALPMLINSGVRVQDTLKNWVGYESILIDLFKKIQQNSG